MPEHAVNNTVKSSTIAFFILLPFCVCYLDSSIVVVTMLCVVSTALPKIFLVTAGYITANVTTTPRKNLPILNCLSVVN
jgi:hypothetical protein